MQEHRAERKQCREKRAALAQEISIRATDFGIKFQRSKSYGELCWHWDEFQGPQNHLAQFNAASMDELIFQYGLLPSKQDHEVQDSLDNAGTEIFDVLASWKGSPGADELENDKKEVTEFICREILATVRRDRETNGEPPSSANPEPTVCPLH